MRHRRRRSYVDERGELRRVDRTALRVIARRVAAVGGETIAQNDNTNIERDFFVLDPQHGAERLAAK